MRSSGLLVGFLLLAACGMRNPMTDPQADLAMHLAQTYDQRERLQVRCGLRIKAPGEDPLNLDLEVTVDRAGGAFVHAFKLGHELFDALITADDHLTLVLLREDERVIEGPLAELHRVADAGPLLLAARGLAIALDELRYGPIDPRRTWQGLPGEAPRLLSDDDDLRQVAIIDAKQNLVEEKRVQQAQPSQPDEAPVFEELVRLRYLRQVTFTSRVTRPQLIYIDLADQPTKLRLTLRDVASTDTDAPLTIDTPAELPRESLTAWAERMREKTGGQAETPSQSSARP